MLAPLPPTSEAELQQRLAAIAGQRVIDLAQQLDVPVPDDLRHHKGWLGELVELALGCDAASLSEPDFMQLGIELKTLPLNSKGQVQESTYVCVVPLQNTHQQQWQTSCVYKKLRKVVWLPVEADAAIPLAERSIGMGLLWTADEATLAALQRDWEELMTYITLGQFDALTAQHGDILQIRPKAANAKVLVDAVGPEGEAIRTLPRGFYLRTSFTRQILSEHYLAG